ncbi:unnamed protein product [Acanthoscelides obtectus]|uniref:Mitochondrial import inner membrane translocase subunit Tim29 n=1 Tax=Acanthoscelides obtectus TaxID=200917 RepID=A0A9P0MIT8_ACAOB|nr:unnamed protein product [Acanthoscelides obtectus]CAK1631022.1 Mitochondrial import inner membrane translocase subunit Tim29 [Acanthoscelides obtectus]
MNRLKFLRISKVNYSNVSIASVEQWKTITEKFNAKIKGTIVENWVKYWKLVARDYRDVAISLKDEARAKPGKTVLYITGFGFLTLCMASNPNSKSFRAKYIQCANDVALVSLNVANPDSVNHLKYIERCFNANTIRYANLGLFSVIWVDEFSSDCDTYECKCAYLQVPYTKLSERILDVGFMGIWWVISRKMLDYDINY